MQITNINIGMNVSDTNKTYQYITTESNGSFIENSINGQRIKLDKAFKNIKDEDDFIDERRYDLDEINISIVDNVSNLYGTIVNNYSNMNPFIIRSRNDEEYVLTYINIDTTQFVPLMYKSNVPIRSTFKTSSTIGCLLYVKVSKESYDVISIIAKDVKNNKFCKLEITIASADESTSDNFYDVDLIYTQKLSKDELGKAISISNRLKGKCTTFKFNSDPNNELVLDTKYVLMNENMDEDLYKDVLSMIKERGDKIMTVYINPESSIEELKEYLQPILNKERIKAFTEVGMTLPYQLLNELRMLYVFKFEYDERVGRIVKKTIKSN